MIQFSETSSAETLKNAVAPIFNQVFKVGGIVLAIIVAILGISCIFAAVIAQFKLKSGDKDASASAKKHLKNILIAFLSGFVILIAFSVLMGAIGSATGMFTTTG